MPRASTPKPKPPRKSSAVTDERHKVFADVLIETNNKTQAARAAGYHPDNVDQVMREEEVQRYLTEARGQIEDVSTIRRIDVLNVFMEAIDMARTLADPCQMINGADKIAKMMGYYAPETLKIEVEEKSRALGNRLRQLTDAELYEMASSQAKVIDGEIIQSDDNATTH